MHKEEYLQSEDDVSTMSPVLPGAESTTQHNNIFCWYGYMSRISLALLDREGMLQ